MVRLVKPRKWGVLVLFVSTTTLLCCALPILLVSLGMGTVVAAIYGEHMPWLRWFGLNEYVTFGVTATILAVAAWVLYRPGRVCPTDRTLRLLCKKSDIWNRRFLWIAVAVWMLGAFAAFGLPFVL